MFGIGIDNREKTSDFSKKCSVIKLIENKIDSDFF